MFWLSIFCLYMQICIFNNKIHHLHRSIKSHAQIWLNEQSHIMRLASKLRIGMATVILIAVCVFCYEIPLFWNAVFTCIYIYIYAFSRRFYPKRLTLHSSYRFTFYQLLLSLGIESMILALLAPCSSIWATGKRLALTICDQITKMRLNTEQKHSCLYEQFIKRTTS